mgnify:CR=1 FL=1
MFQINDGNMWFLIGIGIVIIIWLADKILHPYKCKHCGGILRHIHTIDGDKLMCEDCAKFDNNTYY